MPDLVLTMPQAKQAAQMYEDGKSLREVARHFGRSVNAARNALLTLGVQMRDQRKETADRNRKRAGRKYRQAASVFHIASGPAVLMAAVAERVL